MRKNVVVSAILCAAMASGAFAEAIGMIDYLDGAVELTRNGEAVKGVDIGTKIENLDFIKTSADSQVTISFLKSSGLTGTMTIVPGSSALIRQDQISGSGASEIQLMAGSVNLKVKRLVKGESSVQVRTPTAVLGVRGTEFVVATFSGTAIVACKEGEVYCASSSDMSVSRMSLSSKGESSVPGTMVEILESGKLNSGSFPAGDFDEKWKEIEGKWKSYNVDIVSEDPVSYLNTFVPNWNTYATKVTAHLNTLNSNATLKQWLRDAAAGRTGGSYAAWAKEKPLVVKDLIAMRGDMMIATITLFRIQEVLAHIPASAMNAKLSDGKTMKSFIELYNRQTKPVFSAISLFNAAEKLYMERNDGVSPFSEF
jgi:hypothetical protein